MNWSVHFFWSASFRLRSTHYRLHLVDSALLRSLAHLHPPGSAAALCVRPCRTHTRVTVRTHTSAFNYRHARITRISQASPPLPALLPLGHSAAIESNGLQALSLLSRAGYPYFFSSLIFSLTRDASPSSAFLAVPLSPFPPSWLSVSFGSAISVPPRRIIR